MHSRADSKDLVEKVGTSRRRRTGRPKLNAFFHVRPATRVPRGGDAREDFGGQTKTRGRGVEAEEENGEAAKLGRLAIGRQKADDSR